MEVKKAQQRLALLWFSGGAVMFLYVIFLSVRIVDRETVIAIWSWFLPTIMPTLSLIVGATVSRVLTARESKQEVNLFSYRLALGLSVFYLFIVGMVFLMKPFTSSSIEDVMKISHLWLAPVQGLTSASLGAFFVQKKARQDL